MNDDLKGASLADVLEKLERGKIGHRTAMEWLNVTSYAALVEIMHANGRMMPGHQPMRVSPATRALIRRIFRPVARPGWQQEVIPRSDAQPASSPRAATTPSREARGKA